MAVVEPHRWPTWYWIIFSRSCRQVADLHGCVVLDVFHAAAAVTGWPIGHQHVVIELMPVTGVPPRERRVGRAIPAAFSPMWPRPRCPLGRWCRCGGPIRQDQAAAMAGSPCPG